MAPPAAGETPPPEAAESSANTEGSRWLAALSEPELDFIISLKMLAVKRSDTAGRPHLADAFDLRTLRALGRLVVAVMVDTLSFSDQGMDLERTYEFIASDIFAELELHPHTYRNGCSILNQMGFVLLEDFKEQLKETSLGATVLDRLALSRDPDADASGSCSDSEVFRRHNKDQPKPNSIKEKRKQMQDGCHGESMQSKKKRKLSERR